MYLYVHISLNNEVESKQQNNWKTKTIHNLVERKEFEKIAVNKIHYI